MERTKLITIDYDEYLNLVGCKEILEEAMAARKTTRGDFSHDPYCSTIYYLETPKLFDALKFDNTVREIRLVKEDSRK